MLVTTGALLSGCSGDTASNKRIVYEASSGNITNIYTIDAVDGATRQLTHGTKFDGNPAWSVDHRRILFSSQRDGQDQNDLYTMDAGGGDVRRLTDTNDAGEYSAKYSPDGTSIAYVRQSTDGWTLWRMDAGGANQRMVAGAYSFAEFPSWTHDGTEVLFSAIEDQRDTSGAYGNAHIYSANIATGEVKVRIATDGPDVCPHFSRDGSRLTYAASGAGGELDVFAHAMSSGDTSGASDTALTSDPARDDYANASPDDGTMVFVSDRDGNPELYMMDRDGAHPRRLTTTPDVHENVPDW